MNMTAMLIALQNAPETPAYMQVPEEAASQGYSAPILMAATIELADTLLAKRDGVVLMLDAGNVRYTALPPAFRGGLVAKELGRRLTTAAQLYAAEELPMNELADRLPDWTHEYPVIFNVFAELAEEVALDTDERAVQVATRYLSMVEEAGVVGAGNKQ